MVFFKETKPDIPIRPGRGFVDFPHRASSPKPTRVSWPGSRTLKSGGVAGPVASHGVEK